MVLTLFLVVVGNAAAAGPVGRPLLSGFYSTFSWIVPQGSGVALLRSISYFGGNGALTPLVDPGDMGCGGVSARNPRHRITSELSCRCMTVSPGETKRRRTTTSGPITGRSTPRRRRRRSGSTAGSCGRTPSTTTRRSAASSGPSSSTQIWPSPAGASPTPSARTTTRRGRRSTRSTWRHRWPAPGWNSGWRPTGARRRPNAG